MGNLRRVTIHEGPGPTPDLITGSPYANTAAM